MHDSNAGLGDGTASRIPAYRVRTRPAISKAGMLADC